jgi:hypothetical protein
MTLTAIGNGEKVKLASSRKSTTINLDADYPSDFTPGGNPPYKYSTLLSFKQSGRFYLLAKFRSGPALGSPNSPCSGDNPSTLLLIVANAALKVEKVETEIYDSCIYNGPGRYPQGKPELTKTRFAVYFEEGAKKYDLLFDAAEAGKGLQLIKK